MKPTEQWMAEIMQPILDRIAGGPMTEDEARETRARLAAYEAVDKLALLHPSLGLAFTSKFMDARPQYLLQGNKAADQLQDGCDGCRVDAAGKLICCVNQGEDE